MWLAALIFALPHSHVVSTSSDGNGGAAVVVVIAHAFDAKKPARVHTHYHGDGASVLEGEHVERIEELQSEDPQLIFVLPEAAGNVNAAPTDWSNVNDQAKTTRDALAAVGVADVRAATVSAHSSGGRALAQTLSDEGRLEADRIVLLDCLYEPAATRIREGLLAFAQTAEVIVVRGTNPRERTERFARALGVEALSIGDAGLKKGPHYAALRYALDGDLARR